MLAFRCSQTSFELIYVRSVYTYSKTTSTALTSYSSEEHTTRQILWLQTSSIQSTYNTVQYFIPVFRYDLVRHVSRSDLLSGRSQTLPSLSPRRALAVDGFSVASVSRNDGASSINGDRRAATFRDTMSCAADAEGRRVNKSLGQRELTFAGVPVPVKDYSNSYPSPRPVPVNELVVNGSQAGGRSFRMRSVVLNAPVNNCSGVTIGGRPLQPPVVLDGTSSLSLYPSEVLQVKSSVELPTGKPFEALLSPRPKASVVGADSRSHADESERNALAPFLTNGNAH